MKSNYGRNLGFTSCSRMSQIVNNFGPPILLVVLIEHNIFCIFAYGRGVIPFFLRWQFSY